MDAAAQVDSLVNMFLIGLQAGVPILIQNLKGLLKSILTIELLVGAFAWMSSHLELFGGVMTAVLKAMAFTFLLTSFPFLTNAFIDYCIWGGLTLAGIHGESRVLTIEEFKKPSTVLKKGFTATKPITDYVLKFTGWGYIKNLHTAAMSSFAALVIWITFLAISIHLMWVFLITYIAAAYATIFTPFAVLGPVSFLAQRGLAMMVEGAARLGLAALVTALIFPFVDSFFLTNSPEQNIDIAQAFWLWAGTLFALLLSVGIPAIAKAGVAGIPMLTVSTFFPGGHLITGAIAAAAAARNGGGGRQPQREPRVERYVGAGYEYY